MKLKIYLAPMRGFTNFTYRNTLVEFFGGLDLAVSPFISTVSAARIKDKYFKDVLPENNGKIPIIPQLISKSPEDFIHMAKRLQDFGYETVNWNLGCPFAMVAKKRRGSGLLPYPEQVDDFLEKVIPAIPGKLSIKTRLGRFSSNEMDNLMPIFNRYPLAELIIHPRTGEQMYKGVPDLAAFEKYLAQCIHPVVYNGDINTLDGFKHISARFKNINFWMLGRGVLANPFLPSIIKAGEDKIFDKAAQFQKFHTALFKNLEEFFSGPYHLLKRMKGFWGYFARSFSNSSSVLKKIYKTQDPKIYMDIVNRFLEQEAVWENNYEQ